MNNNNFKILIPARRNSKGLPFKNRKLFSSTADIVPDEYKNITYVFTDDEIIQGFGREYGFQVLDRNPESALDESTTKELMEDFCRNFSENQTIIMLYLTYPERTWDDVEKAIEAFSKTKAKSLLCKKQVKQTPYLMMYELENGRGKQVIQHNLSRRQDYRQCFEISHFISIIDSNELPNLNNNLYNEDTYFLPVRDVKDID